MTAKKQIHLGAHFPGVNHHTVWTDPSHHAETQSAFASFQHLAATAERGLFDFVFLAEGLRLREHRGQLVDQDVVGRPDTYAVLAALAGVTTHVGLAGTINATFNDPYELARQFATLDHLSAGRAAWNVVTSSDAFHGANFRRGGYLAYPDRYERAREVVEAARALWDAWAPDAIVDDGPGLRAPRVARHGAHRRPARRHRGHAHPAAAAAGPPGDHPGGRLRRWSRARRAGGGRGVLPAHRARGRQDVLRRRQGSPRPLRPSARGPADPAGLVVRAGRHHRGGRGAAARDPAADRAAVRRARVRRAAVEPRPVRLRRRRPAADDRPAGRRPVDHQRSRELLQGPARDRPPVA